MGTLFYLDMMAPTLDGADEAEFGGERQVEIFKISGRHDMTLRVGDVGDKHMASGPTVTFSEAQANEFLSGFTKMMFYLGYRITADIPRH